MNTMTYKGYAARIEYSDDGCFIGHIAAIQDVVGLYSIKIESDVAYSDFGIALDDHELGTIRIPCDHCHGSLKLLGAKNHCPAVIAFSALRTASAATEMPSLVSQPLYS